jgi:diacylglycerol kinase
MVSEDDLPRRSWAEKFRNAFRGLKEGIRGQSSFFGHFFAAVAVLAAGLAMRVDCLQWCLLILCITLVFAAEMFNSALESMARAITDQRHSDIGNALDIGSAAVLIVAGGAAAVGLVIFLNRLGLLLGWWS